MASEQRPMRVLVAWGSERGGTEGIGQMIGAALQQASGLTVVLSPASRVGDVSGYDAAIIGGALYANGWHRDARRLVERQMTALRKIPVWLFSSGPLDDSSVRREIPPVPQVEVLAERVGACGHKTFGGRLAPDAKGFPASAMAKSNSGDWRDPDAIRAWATTIARVLPEARPVTPREPPARSLVRLTAHGVAGWALCAALMAGLMQIASQGVALAVHAVAAPLIFLPLAFHYFRPRGPRGPFEVAVAFTAMVALLDAIVVAGGVLRSFAMFTSVVGTWLPFALIFAATWVTGRLVGTLPWTSPAEFARDAKSGESAA